jgi:polar amino acid transport system substrate-binding protein
MHSPARPIPTNVSSRRKPGSTAQPTISRSRAAAVLLFIAALINACATSAPPPPPAAARAELAPGGTLRAAINFGNPILATKDATRGEPRGVSVDIARELAARLGVRLELVTFDAAGKVVAAARSGAWDIAFVAIDPARGADMLQTSPYVIIEGAYLVRTDSPMQRNEDVDRDGVRIAVGKGSAYDLFLGRELKRARMVYAAT